jgi:hypothetical protein
MMLPRIASGCAHAGDAAQAFVIVNPQGEAIRETVTVCLFRIIKSKKTGLIDVSGSNYGKKHYLCTGQPPKK